MKATRDTFVEWLRDAHAAEKQALIILKSQADRLESYPDLQRRIRQHSTETQNQLARLDEILASCGESGSMVKDVTGRLMAMGQSLAGMIATDEVVKSSLFSFAFEQMEIASYRILVTTAELLGDQKAVAALRQCLVEEEAMAAWLAEQLPSTVSTYLGRLEADEKAAR